MQAAAGRTMQRREVSHKAKEQIQFLQLAQT
jgi:hypothetical protein